MTPLRELNEKMREERTVWPYIPYSHTEKKLTKFALALRSKALAPDIPMEKLREAALVASHYIHDLADYPERMAGRDRAIRRLNAQGFFTVLMRRKR